MRQKGTLGALVVGILLSIGLAACGNNGGSETPQQAACKLMASEGQIPPLTLPQTTAFPGQDQAIENEACPGQEVLPYSAPSTTASTDSIDLEAGSVSTPSAAASELSDGSQIFYTNPADPSQQTLVDSGLTPAWTQTISYSPGTTIQLDVTAGGGGESAAGDVWQCSISFDGKQLAREQASGEAQCQAVAPRGS